MIYAIADKNHGTSAVHLTVQLEKYFETHDLISLKVHLVQQSINFCDAVLTEEWTVLDVYCRQYHTHIKAAAVVSCICLKLPYLAMKAQVLTTACSHARRW
jgi:hypothetical protein